MKTSLLLALCLVAACRPPKAGDTLVESVRAYNEGVRWERFANAAVHVPPKERSEFLDEADERSKDLRITDYDIVRVDQKSDKIAQVQIKVSWYLDSEQTLRETSAMQTWERHGKSWWVVEEKRVRGVEMPGLRNGVASAKLPVAGAGGADLRDPPSDGDAVRSRPSEQ